MQLLERFAEIVKPNEPLASYTHLRLGGVAEMLVQPRSRDELAQVLRHCHAKGIPIRVLGGGGNVLVPDDGVPGVVLRLNEPAFMQIAVEGARAHCGAGVPLSALISETARHGLGGLEALVGIQGTVGGALRCNAGDRAGEIGRHVRHVEVMDYQGVVHTRDRDEFGDSASSLDDPVLLAAEFELEHDQPAAIVKHMRKAWIQRKARQPLSFQAACRVFKNPRGLNAAELIVQTGLSKTRVGGAELSERDANYVVAHEGATARDVHRLIELVRTRVHERFNVELELEISPW